MFLSDHWPPHIKKKTKYKPGEIIQVIASTLIYIFRFSNNIIQQTVSDVVDVDVADR